MANYFNLTLDTTGPANVELKIENNASYATSRLVDCQISTTDSSTSSYQMKIWGDVDVSYDNNVQATESNSQWITFTSTKQIQLASGDGSKSVYVKLRDDVYNESAQATDSIILDTTRPVVTISGPDVTKISKKNGKNVSSFSFSSDQDFVQYKIKVVGSSGSPDDTGTQIGSTNGSTNMSGSSGNAGTAINCTINGTDLETASAGDGTKVIKVFVKDAAGNWSA